MGEGLSGREASQVGESSSGRGAKWERAQVGEGLSGRGLKWERANWERAQVGWCLSGIHSSHAAPSDARKPDKSLLSSLIEQTQPSVVVKIVKLAIERFRDAFGISSASDGAVSAGHRQHAIAAQRVLCELVDALCNATSATRKQNATEDVPARSLPCACV